jgi:hypothetical protein
LYLILAVLTLTVVILTVVILAVVILTVVILLVVILTVVIKTVVILTVVILAIVIITVVYTVKPVYNGHPWGSKKAAVVQSLRHRWSLFTVYYYSILDNLELKLAVVDRWPLFRGGR